MSNLYSVLLSVSQDLTELQKERQCLEKQNQQEVNKLNQELQQARTLHNALQAQSDKVSLHALINKTNRFQKSKVTNLHCKLMIHVTFMFWFITVTVLLFQPFPVSLSCFSYLYPIFSRPLSSYWDYFCYLYQRSINLSHVFSHTCFLPWLFPLTLCFTLLLFVFLFSFFPPCLLSSSLRPPIFSVSHQWQG